MPGSRLLRLGPHSGAELAEAEDHTADHGDDHAQYGGKPDQPLDPVTPATERIPVKSEPSDEPGEWIL
ncbi:hypothetical protein Pth03_58050 [Planotetraspora thailandica]|uniref:Uncharacterized protein n=1 Tax=Planotetraspora thailandica TaxID=487172 RepID=A0A8J3V5Q2_9ACTN|nr:hypothetical protein Pth03_58050 [Planotetraspora thailandica]